MVDEKKKYYDPWQEPLIIDTPEAAKNLEELFESGICWKRGDTKWTLGDANDDVIRGLIEKYNPKR